MSVSPISGYGGLEYSFMNRAEGSAAKASAVGSAAETGSAGPERCKTGASRTYKDRSDDPSVSFQTATHLSPEEAPQAVSAHEQQHVSHEQARASEGGRKVLYQTVSIETSICPEGGRPYVSGGKTTTVTAADNNAAKSSAWSQLLDLFAGSGYRSLFLFATIFCAISHELCEKPQSRRGFHGARILELMHFVKSAAGLFGIIVQTLFYA